MSSLELRSYVDVKLSLIGETIPLDHGYDLFGAVSRQVPELHRNRDWGLHAIAGRQRSKGVLDLDGRSNLKIRLPAEDIGKLVPLVGQKVSLRDAQVELGAMSVEPLKPAASLWANYCTVKGYQDHPDAFIGALKNELRGFEGLGQPVDDLYLSALQRKVMTIKDKKVVGFKVEIHRLQARASLMIQQRGLGGRRHMGGGLFNELKRRSL